MSNEVSKYKPRGNIFEYLLGETKGGMPRYLSTEVLPSKDDGGMVTLEKDTVVIDLHVLFTQQLGLDGVQVPMNTFLEVCEHLLQLSEEKAKCL